MKYSAENTGKIIRKNREKQQWSQQELGKKLGVTGKQVSNYEKGTPIPPMDVLMKLCDVFACELGYLLGEEDYSEGSKIRTAIYKATGLTNESMATIEKVTGNGRDSIYWGHDAEKYRRVVNRLFSSERFVGFIERLGHLDDHAIAFLDAFEEVQRKLGDRLFNEALAFYSSNTDYLNDPNAEELLPEQYEAIALIDQAADKQRNCDWNDKVSRYDLFESFQNLINDIYPRWQR